MKDLKERLRSECEKAGGVTAWTKEHCVPRSAVSNVLCGERDTIPASVAKALERTPG